MLDKFSKLLGVQPEGQCDNVEFYMDCFYDSYCNKLSGSRGRKFLIERDTEIGVICSKSDQGMCCLPGQ